MPEIDKLNQVKEKIEGAENILVALSKNPSVDEMAAAIGLTLLLDEAGKHATAIYSGATPNALEFLKPEETFESDTNSLQDFIIALNKEKADHLRYKIEGDYVKVYITPYKTEISEKDLEFSHGDFNVDLIIALNVKSANELDKALAEYGRIMHDAGAVNITAGQAGEFGEVEWNDMEASSVSEMVVNLVNTTANLSAKMTKEMATAFLTGIVAATERFSNEKTTPATMEVASSLMKAGADQKLVADNMELTGEVEHHEAASSEEESAKEDGGGLNVRHAEEVPEEPEVSDDEAAEAREKLEEMVKPAEDGEAMLEQLKQVANDVKPPEFKPGQNPAAEVAPETPEKEANDIPEMSFGAAEPAETESIAKAGEMTLTPPSEVLSAPSEEKPVEADEGPKFGTQIAPPADMSTTPSDEVAKVVAEITGEKPAEVTSPSEEPASEPANEPAAGASESSGPSEPSEPELPMPDVQLPPPPAPPIDMEGMTPPEGDGLPQIQIKDDPTLPEVDKPAEEPQSAADAMMGGGEAPAEMPAAVEDPGAFKIPGQE